jgi:hypothetical protein
MAGRVSLLTLLELGLFMAAAAAVLGRLTALEE